MLILCYVYVYVHVHASTLGVSAHVNIHAGFYLHTGIDVDTPEGHMKAHAVLLICCVDLPAQAKL